MPQQPLNPCQGGAAERPLPDKKAVLIVASVCAIALILGVWLGIGFRRIGQREPLYILQFMVLLYYIPAIKTAKKSVVYCIFIPFFCTLLLVMNDIAFQFSGWSIPPYLKGEGTGYIVYSLIEEWVSDVFFAYLATFSWVVTPFLILVYRLRAYVSKYDKRHPEGEGAVLLSPFQKTVMGMRLFQHKRLTFCTVLIYFIFMVIYYKLYRLYWLESVGKFNWDRGHFRYVCLLSFTSLFILAPAMVGQVKKTILFCMTAPLFWSVAVYVILTILAIFFVRYPYTRWCIIINSFFQIHLKPTLYPNQPTDLLSIYFYIDRYLNTRAWLIGFPLLLVCCIYAWLAKLELARQTGGQPVPGKPF